MDTNELGEDVIFFEPTAAARSLKNSWTRMASTYDSIQVILSREHLIIKPRTMLSKLIATLQFDLNHVIPTHRITAVEPRGEYLSYRKIRVGFSTEDGEHEGVELYLRKSDDFLEQIGTVIRQ